MNLHARLWFAARLQARRLELGLSQQQLADRCAGLVDQSAITRTERGVRGVRIEEAVRLAAALEIALVELLPPDPRKPRADAYAAGVADERARVRLLLGDLLTTLLDPAQPPTAPHEGT